MRARGVDVFLVRAADLLWTRRSEGMRLDSTCRRLGGTDLLREHLVDVGVYRDALVLGRRREPAPITQVLEGIVQEDDCVTLLPVLAAVRITARKEVSRRWM